MIKDISERPTDHTVFNDETPDFSVGLKIMQEYQLYPQVYEIMLAIC